MTSTHGIRTCRFSSRFLIQSKPFALPVTIADEFPMPPAMRFFTLSIAALANDPPVPLSAEMAILAVSLNASVNVAFPLSNAPAVSLMLVALIDGSPCQRGSNQSA